MTNPPEYTGEFPEDTSGYFSDGSSPTGSTFGGQEPQWDGGQAYGGGQQPGDQAYGGQTYGAQSYGNPAYGAQPYGAQPHGAQPYDAQPYGTQPYGTQPYGAPSYGAQPYGTQPYGAQPFGAVQPYGQMAAVARKEPALMLVASFFIPGLGTILNGDTGKGIGILVGYFISYLLIFVLIGIPMVFGFWIWGMVDAYQGAKAFNARHGLP